MIEYSVITVDLTVAHTGSGLELQVDAEKLIVWQVDDVAAFSIDQPAGSAFDEIPAQAASEFCAAPGERIGKIYVVNAAAASGELIFVAVSNGQITLYSG